MFIKVFKELGIKTINLVRKEDAIKELVDIGGDVVLNTSNAEFDN